MRRLLLIVTMAVTVAAAMTATEAPRRVKTTRGPRLKAEYTAPAAGSRDTVGGEAADSVIAFVGLSGYDKPLRSRRESLFVTNRSARTLSGLEIEIAYSDMSGRSLHRRPVTVAVDLPPGETKRVEFGSWDSQQSFYYHRSPRPSKAQATPYDVKCRITGVSSGDTVYVSNSVDKHL